MSDFEDPAAWVNYEDDDLDTARYGLRRKKTSTYIICFHAQQGIGKYLKAILVAHRIVFPKIHDLKRLNDMLVSSGIILGVASAILDRVSWYAVMVRYPGDQPTLDKAKEAVETAKLVRKFSRKHLGLS